GFLNGVQVSPALFHHDFGPLSEVFILSGGDTTPTQPGQTAQDLEIVSPIDTITIQPYLPSGAQSAEVDEVSIDVSPGQVTVIGQNGQEILPPAQTRPFTSLAASSNDVIGKDTAGQDIKLGPISQVVLNHIFELDNLRAVVFFPGLPAPPTAN